MSSSVENNEPGITYQLRLYVVCRDSAVHTHKGAVFCPRHETKCQPVSVCVLGQGEVVDDDSITLSLPVTETFSLCTQEKISV